MLTWNWNYFSNSPETIEHFCKTPDFPQADDAEEDIETYLSVKRKMSLSSATAETPIKSFV